MARLHDAGYVHYSAYQRNLLVQPGPLSDPSEKRSLSTPSFRVVDFGRTTRFESFMENTIGKTSWNTALEKIKENEAKSLADLKSQNQSESSSNLPNAQSCSRIVGPVLDKTTFTYKKAQLLSVLEFLPKSERKALTSAIRKWQEIMWQEARWVQTEFCAGVHGDDCM